MTDQQILDIAKAVSANICAELTELIAETVISDYSENEVEVAQFVLNNRKMTLAITLKDSE